MAPSILSRKRTYAELSQSPEVSRFKNFDDITIWDLNKASSIVVRVEVKFPVEIRGYVQRFILVDTTGSKIEAIVRDTNVSRFNMLLTEGRTYTMHHVFHNIRSSYDCTLDHRTVVEPSIVAIQFPPYPKNIMPFTEVYQCPDKTFVDIAGIVVRWCETERVGTYPNQKLYREVILMDERKNLLVVGIWSNLLARYAISLPSAAADYQVILGTMLRNNFKHGCYETSDHTTFAFNPAHHATGELQALRRSLVNGSFDLTFVKRFMERRWEYLATVVK
ncbi:hypothetical protein ACP70R_001315 [Stipagrostis hirtigluma subsp. patula]